jgi:predicted nucleotidyltransferase
MPHLSPQYGVKQIRLFKSFSRNQQHGSSDADIGVEFESPIDLRFVGFADYLEEFPGRPADILTPDGIRGIRNPEVLQMIRGSFMSSHSDEAANLSY